MRAAFVYSDAFATYDLGPDHPLKPRRYGRTYDLLRAYGAFSSDCPLVAPRLATEEEVLSVHTPGFLEALRSVDRDPDAPELRRFGLGTTDNPTFPGLLEASLIYTGASATCADLIIEGKTTRAFNISGGLHHAMPDRASGFCTLNDCAVAISRLLERFQRVVYVDIDAHHGDGVEAIFYSDPRVMTISLHESGHYLFPGSGYPEDLGQGDACGTAVNVPLAPYTGDDAFLYAFNEVVPPLVQAFGTEVIVTQLGADAHTLDPLAHLSTTTRMYEAALAYYDGLGIPWLALGGGGYNQAVVPRVWALAWSYLSGADLPDALPEAYRQVYGGQVLRDPAPSPELDATAMPAFTAAQREVAKVKALVFPYYGLSA